MHTREQYRALWVVAAAELLGTSMWFSGTAALPQLSRLWQTDLSVSAWLTMSVQVGFVTGAFVSALFNLPDIINARRLFAASCVVAAAANGAFAWVAAEHMGAAFVLRFLTGAALAGVYPVGMKILSGWFRDGRGTALGVLVGALTVGKATPYAVEGAGDLPWRWVVLSGSLFALLAAVMVALWVREGPYSTPQPPLDLRQVGEIFRNRPLRLANFGYFGHMWELYSMWGWIALMLTASAGQHTRVVSLAAFVAIASGGIGCVWAGRAADAAGALAPEARTARRARVTIVAMGVSAACCLLAAAVFENFWLLALVSFVWGISVVADSAQFSTIVSEVADRRYIGTALTLQTAIGFLLTVVSIRVIGDIGQQYGWRVAAACLAIGPVLGIWAMSKLRK